jgi:hypothetical protein
VGRSVRRAVVGALSLGSGSGCASDGVTVRTVPNRAWARADLIDQVTGYGASRPVLADLLEAARRDGEGSRGPSRNGRARVADRGPHSLQCQPGRACTFSPLLASRSRVPGRPSHPAGVRLSARLALLQSFGAMLAWTEIWRPRCRRRSRGATVCSRYEPSGHAFTGERGGGACADRSRRAAHQRTSNRAPRPDEVDRVDPSTAWYRGRVGLA